MFQENIMEFTEKHKENIKKSRLRYYQFKYNWELAKPYWNKKMEKAKGNRKQRFITFKEFKEFKADRNKTIKEY